MNYYKTKLKDTWEHPTITNRLILENESYISSTGKIINKDFTEISEDEFNEQLEQFKPVVEPVEPKQPVTNEEIKRLLLSQDENAMVIMAALAEIYEGGAL